MKTTDLEKNVEKEWIITNGLGSFASSTVAGVNTRRYHGLLVTALTPPSRRMLRLSKLDESIEFESGKKYDLYTNICKDYIGQGYKNQIEFQKEILPVFKYKVEDTKITKVIVMQYKKNTVGILYKIRNGKQKVKLTLAPIVNYRDFHSSNTSQNIDLNQVQSNGKAKIIIDGNAQTPMYMYIKNAKYTEFNNTMFYNMFYLEEEKRGFYPMENHVVSGIYEIEIQPNEEKDISFICSTEENIENIDVKDLIEKEIVRQNQIYNNSLLMDRPEKDLIKTFLTALDNFVVYRPEFSLHTIIAGYPWFLDWGRDTLISFEGALLIPKRFKEAKEVLLTVVRDIKQGLIPNGYSGYDNRPLYNSVDASLLLFEAVQKYINYTGDYGFIKKEFYQHLKEIIRNYKNGIDIDDNNIYLDTDNLIVSGTENTQNTWMDAKYGAIAITPRNGKCVEINSMWYNANKIMEKLAIKFENKKEAMEYEKNASRCKNTFEEKFYNKKRKCLYDVIGDSKIRPNQLFSLSLEYPVINPNSEIAKEIINTVEKKLLNNYGIKSLAKGEIGYTEQYVGSPELRDRSYHQGITWTFLFGMYYNALKNMKNICKVKKEKAELENKIKDFCNKTKKTFQEEIYNRGVIGSIAEIYDSKKPFNPKGAFAQCWSVSEIFRIILEK